MTNCSVSVLYRISQLLLEIAIRFCLRVEVLGRENVPDRGPYVIVSNHSSVVDPPLIGMAFRKQVVNFLAKKELFNDSFAGRWVRGINMVCVDRACGISGMKDALDRLKNGKVLGIFPEGRRIPEDETAEAKKGIGFIMSRSKVPVVPVYIEGSGIALPKGGKVLFGAKVKVHIRKKVNLEDLFTETSIRRGDYEGITNFIMERIKEEKG